MIYLWLIKTLAIDLPDWGGSSEGGISVKWNHFLLLESLTLPNLTFKAVILVFFFFCGVEACSAFGGVTGLIGAESFTCASWRRDSRRQWHTASCVGYLWVPSWRILTIFLPLTRRDGGALPDGTAVEGERLVFRRPLRLSDDGVYQCTAQSSMGTGKSEYVISVAGELFKRWNFFIFTDAVLQNVSSFLLCFVEEIIRGQRRRRTSNWFEIIVIVCCPLVTETLKNQDLTRGEWKPQVVTQSGIIETSQQQHSKKNKK